jgi:hypothetical protein
MDRKSRSGVRLDNVQAQNITISGVQDAGDSSPERLAAAGGGAGTTDEALADVVPRHSWKEYARQIVVIIFCLFIFFLNPAYILHYFALKLGFCSPVVKVVLPWSLSPEQKEKGNRIVDKVKKLRLEHWDPDKPKNADAIVPTDVSWIKYFFHEDKGLAENLENAIEEGHFLEKPIELSPQERSRLQGLFQDPVCKGDLEFWMSSQE